MSYELKDYNMGYGWVTQYIPAASLSGALYTNMSTAEVGSLETGGLKADEDGEYVTHVMPVPAEWDVTHAVLVRCWWSSASTTATDEMDWIATYETLNAGDALTAPASINDALDTAIATGDLNDATANSPQATAWVTVNANTFTKDLIQWKFEADAFTASLDPTLLGVEFAYRPYHFTGGGTPALTELGDL